MNTPAARTRAAPLLALLFMGSLLLLQSIRLSGDGLSYYAYLRSALFDGDLDFANEFADFNPMGHATPDPAAKTATGLVANPYAIGAALLWAPFVALVHLVAPGATGYELQYAAAVTLGTDFYALLGLLAMFTLARRFVGVKPALTAVLAVCLGTAYAAYLYFDPSYAHVLSATWVAIFAVGCLAYREMDTWGRLVLMAAAGGVMVLVRWQNLLVTLLFLAPWAFELVRAIRARAYRQVVQLWGQAALFYAIIGLLFLPQMWAWHRLYGSWLLVPMGSGSMNWLTPALLEVLLAARNGLFSWTPLVLLGLLGLPLLYRRDRRLTVSLALIAVAQWWVNASVADWWGGSAFGARRFVGLSVLVVLGLAALLERWPRMIWAAAGLVVWNLALLTQYLTGAINPAGPTGELAGLAALYLGQLEHGLPQLYRLLGRSTWLDMALRSGVLAQNWGYVLGALAWLFVLAAALGAALLLYRRTMNLSA